MQHPPERSRRCTNERYVHGTAQHTGALGWAQPLWYCKVPSTRGESGELAPEDAFLRSPGECRLVVCTSPALRECVGLPQALELHPDKHSQDLDESDRAKLQIQFQVSCELTESVMKPRVMQLVALPPSSLTDRSPVLCLRR